MLLACSIAFSHPGIGIVKDSKGNIFYSDLKHVWKIPAGGGQKTVVVHNVHTHELHMDARDNLYGEHTWYNGEHLNTWGHYVWCLKSDGALVRVKDSTAGFLENYSFVQDIEGNMYWVERWKVSRFKKKTPGGQITTIAEGKFRDVRWMHCTKDGVIYFLDLEKLYVLRNGKITLLADDLAESTTAFSFVGERHNPYGLWTDANENIYVAVFGGQLVKKITPSGKVTIFLHSTSPWSPTSGVFDHQGNLWLQEYSITNDCRVRKIERASLAGQQHNAAFMMNDAFPFAVAAAVLLGIMVVLNPFPKQKATDPH